MSARSWRRFEGIESVALSVELFTEPGTDCEMARTLRAAPSALRMTIRFLSVASRRPSSGCSGRSSPRARSRVRPPLIRSADIMISKPGSQATTQSRQVENERKRTSLLAILASWHEF
jgi:hypothetical protein